MLNKPFLIVLVVTLALLASVTSNGSAIVGAHPGDDAILSVCVKEVGKSGEMRVLGTDKSCKKNETLVNLSKSFNHHVREGTPEIGFEGNIHTPKGGFVAGNTTTYADGEIVLSTVTNLNIDGGTLFIKNASNRVGIGTTNPRENLEITGNFRLPKSTATAGVIKSGNRRFIHNFGFQNFFAGVNAGNLAMTGAGRNTGVGVGALVFNTTGSDNTATGQDALRNNTTGSDNTATGQDALRNNTTGSDNTATGQDALLNNTTGTLNTATGQGALLNNTTGNLNTAAGQAALFTNTTGSNNTAAGNGALQNNITGFQNTAAGSDALFSNTTGSNNTATGQGALQNNTTGSFNTAAGQAALFTNTTGNFNTAAGRAALENNTTGVNNTAIGFQADVGAGNLNNATAIGNGAIVNASNKIRLGNSNVTIIEGSVAFTSSSDVRLKTNIEQLTDVLEKLEQIRGVSYERIDLDETSRRVGVIAQEVEAVFPELVFSSGEEGYKTVAYSKLTAVLIEAVKELHAENTALEARLAVAEQSLGLASPSSAPQSSLSSGTSMILMIAAGLGMIIGGPGLVLGYRRSRGSNEELG